MDDAGAAVVLVDQIGGLTNGAAIRQHHLIRALSARCRVTVIVLDDTARGSESDLADQLGANVLVIGPRRRRHGAAATHMLRHPASPWRVARVDVGELAARVRPVIDGRSAQLIWASSPIGIEALDPAARRRTIVDLIDRPSSFHRAQLAAARRRLGRWVRGRQRSIPPPRVRDVLKDVDGWVRSGRSERRLIDTCYRVVSCNPDDAGPPPGHRVVPNTIADPGAPLASRPMERVVVPAGFRYGPNLDGAEWFLLDVLPALRRHRPDLPVTLVGSAPGGLDVLARRHDVEVTGWVPDLTQWLRPGTTIAVPVLAASGTRLKIIEAWAHGLPVVSTSVGAEGLGGRDGHELLLADDPTAFADALVSTAEPEVAATLSAAGRDHYARTLAPGVIRAEVEEPISPLVDGAVVGNGRVVSS